MLILGGIVPHRLRPIGSHGTRIVASSAIRRPRAAAQRRMPLDAEHDLVQSIKLAGQMMGRGSERVRQPHLPLAGARRAAVMAMVECALATRPVD